MTKPRPRGSAGDDRHRTLASWIFGGILLAAVLAIFFAAPDRLPQYKQPIVPILAALLCGFLAFFLTGSIGLGFSWGKATGSIAVVVLVLFTWKQLLPAAPGLFRVRVTLLDPDGRPVPDAELHSSIGGERKPVDGGWELDIPAASLPADHSLTLYASKPSAFLSGHQTLLLSEEDPQPSVSLKLERDESATIGGQVQDAAGAALAGARVNVAGHETEAMATSASGSFRLPAHAAAGQAVRLHAEKAGYAPVEQEDLAGNPEVLLRLAPR